MYKTSGLQQLAAENPLVAEPQQKFFRLQKVLALQKKNPLTNCLYQNIRIFYEDDRCSRGILEMHKNDAVHKNDEVHKNVVRHNCGS